MNFETIVKDVTSALKSEIGSGYDDIAGLVDSQSRLLAQQAEWIAKSRLGGSLKDNDELYEFFVDQMARHTRELAQTVAMKTILTLEKAWNAIANILWGAMRQILGAAGVPGQMLPKTPPLSV